MIIQARGNVSKDRVLECKTCGKEFIFSASEQEFFASKGLTNEPSKCKDCRRRARDEKTARVAMVKCTHCGKVAQVTFTVTYPETLLCDDCFNNLKPKSHIEDIVHGQPVATDLDPTIS